MAGVIVSKDAEEQARQALRQLRKDFRTPAGRPLSAKNDTKTHDRRTHASRLLAQVDGLKVIYVVADKSALSPGSYKDDVVRFYNVTAFEVFKRILWTANRWPGGRHAVEVRFGHVAKHPHEDTHRYFQLKRDRNLEPSVPFALVSKLAWVNAGDFEMSQVADLYGGFLRAAFWPTSFGYVEGSYLRNVWHQIRNSENCILTLGLYPRPTTQWAVGQPWWPCQPCTGRH